MLKKIKNGKNYGYVILALICLAICVPSFAQYQVMVLGDRLRTAMGLSQSQYSSIATAPLVMGILAGFLSGMLADKYGVKAVTASIIVTTAGVCLRLAGGGFFALYIAMFLVGCSATFINTATPKIMGSWFAPASAAAMMGLALASTNAAMALGSGTAALFPSTQAAFKFTAAAALVITVLWLLLIKEKKAETGRTEERAPFKESLSVVIGNRGVWAAALCALSMSTGLTGCGVFMPQALMSRGLSEAGAGAMGMSLTFGYMATSLVSPVLIKKVGRTKRRLQALMTVYGVLMTLFLGAAWLAPIGLPLVAALFVEGFLIMGFEALMLALPVSMKSIGTRYSATATGLIVTVQLIGSVVITSYIAAPVAGDNYYLINLIMAAAGCIFLIFSRFLPLDDLVSQGKA